MAELSLEAAYHSINAASLKLSEGRVGHNLVIIINGVVVNDSEDFWNSVYVAGIAIIAFHFEYIVLAIAYENRIVTLVPPEFSDPERIALAGPAAQLEVHQYLTNKYIGDDDLSGIPLDAIYSRFKFNDFIRAEQERVAQTTVPAALEEVRAVLHTRMERLIDLAQATMIRRRLEEASIAKFLGPNPEYDHADDEA
jgi:hypothetical protein